MNSPTAGFCKNEDCPSSNELLAYQNGDLTKTPSREIGRHLASCEFCDAEVGFYSNYPQTAEDTAAEIGEIPAPLFELAEALLKRKHGDSFALNALLQEKDGWSLTDREAARKVL